MDPLTRWAVVGTARQTAIDAAPDPLAASVLAKLGDVPAPRRLLLAAGARAVASRAGAPITTSAEPFSPCAAETRPACSAKAARILMDIFGGGQREILLEALALIDRAGQRLPHSLLPTALGARTEGQRAAVRLVLGERGPWLARMNPAWSWAEKDGTGDPLAELERAWREGKVTRRRDALARARTIDPARARGWVESSWSSDKAEERAVFLVALTTGISAGDEPFISAQLHDRAIAVRNAAQLLLPRIAGSAFVGRMIARTEAVLDLKNEPLGVESRPRQAAELGVESRPRQAAELRVHPPESADAEASRDGLSGRPPQGTGALAFWLVRALSAVPPSHWTARFAMPASALVDAAAKSDFAAAVAEGWTKAALIHEDPEWLCALWDFWQRCDEKIANAAIANAMLVQILQRLPTADAGSRVEPLFGEGPTHIHLTMALCALATPWPETIGDRYIEALEREIHTTSLRTQAMMASLRDASLALPHAVLPRALEVLAQHAHTVASGGKLAPQLQSFMEVLRLRHALVQEIRP